MPLLDHFHAPLSPQRHWESFHVNWAGAMADALNERLLPEGYFAEEHAHLGPRVEIDVATFTETGGVHRARDDGGTSTLPPQLWTPPAPAISIPAAFPDTFEVLVIRSEGGTRLVAAIELVSPGNKDREPHRAAFVAKCASYLAQGISLIVIDIVTSRQGNLHNALMRLLGETAGGLMPTNAALYSVAYRPIVRGESEQIDIWPQPLRLGGSLPTLPLALDAEMCLPLDLDETYTTACQRRRLG
jgi:hypothetical protein